jgi:hypothetical protein
MRQGKKTAEVLAAEARFPFQHLEPSEHLREEQKEIWRGIVSTRVPEWFSEEHVPLLEAYCLHTVVIRALDARIQQFRDMKTNDLPTIREHRSLLAEFRAQTETLKRLGACMRLTQRSTFHARPSEGKRLTALRERVRVPAASPSHARSESEKEEALPVVLKGGTLWG